MSAEQELVVVARIGAPHGVRGWLKVDCFGAGPSEALLAEKDWFIGEPSAWQPVRVAEIETHGTRIAVRLEGMTDRDAAGRLRHKQIGLPRAVLLPTQEGEYYWHDLHGLQVLNLQGEAFGEVVDLIDTGANQVLVVQGERQRLIPFLEHVISKVDLAARRIVVDWDADF